MLALDAHPDVAELARQGHIADRYGSTTVEAEAGSGGSGVTPPSPWTGESQYSNGSYLVMAAGVTVRWQLPASAQPRLVLPIADLRPGSAAVTRWSAAGCELGRLRHGRIGPQGASPAPGALLPVTLPGELPAGGAELVATASGGEAVLDAIMLEPLVSRYVIEGNGHSTTLLRSAARTPQNIAGQRGATIEAYDAQGVLRGTGRPVVLPGGFTVIRR
jgi:hypothetical protein